MKDYKYHPACLLLPKMDADEYAALRKSIAVGYDPRHPIALFDGMILDGRHRYTACKDEGIEPTFTDWDGGDPFEFVRREHEARRSWKSQEQKALVIGGLLEQSAAWAEKKRKIADKANAARSDAAKGNDNASKAREKTVVGQSDPPLKKSHKARQAKAESIGVPSSAVKRADFIKAHDPALAAQVASGEVVASAAIRDIKRRENVANLESVSAKKIKELEGVYDVVVIDPPWPIEKIERDCRPNQVNLDYPTMTVEEIQAMKLPCAEDCHVWMWTTHRFLPASFDILKAWGLKYVCCFTWHKPGGFQPVGLPQYNSEFILYARKGTPQFVSTKQLSTCFDAQRGKHSVKPEEFYGTVRRVTAGRRVDMFSRREIDGFDAWGNEA